MSAVCQDTLLLNDGTLLNRGDVFRIKLTTDSDGTSARWSYFSFHSVRLTAPKTVSAYGGDADPNGRRQWHAFDYDRIRSTAEFVRSVEADRGWRERRRAA